MAFVAEEAETVTGYCWGYYLRRPDNWAMAYVRRAQVAEPHRRRGIGRGPHARVPRCGSGARRDKGALDTGSGNVAARTFYDAIGGQIAEQGDTTNYWWNLDRSPQGVTRP